MISMRYGHFPWINNQLIPGRNTDEQHLCEPIATVDDLTTWMNWRLATYARHWHGTWGNIGQHVLEDWRLETWEDSLEVWRLET